MSSTTVIQFELVIKIPLDFITLQNSLLKKLNYNNSLDLNYSRTIRTFHEYVIKF